MCGISKVTFEISHKISCPYIEMYVMLKIQKLFDLRVRTYFGDVPFPANILNAVYPIKYAHEFIVLWFVVIIMCFLMYLCDVFTHILQDRFIGTRAII